jgi:hypothetical protein
MSTGLNVGTRQRPLAFLDAERQPTVRGQPPLAEPDLLVRPAENDLPCAGSGEESMRNTGGSLWEGSRGETYTPSVHTPDLHTSKKWPKSLQLLHLGAVAQLGEHLLCTQGVVGSSPIRSTV